MPRVFPCGCPACFTRRERAFEAVMAGMQLSAVVSALDEETQDDLGETARQLLAEAEDALDEANQEFEDFAKTRESGELPFDKDELLLAAILALLMLRAGVSVRAAMRDAMRRDVDARSIEQALSSATPEMRRVFDSIRAETTAIISNAVGLGASQVSGGVVTDRVRERVIAKIVASVEHFTNGYFEAQVIPSIMAKVTALTSSPNPEDLTDGADDIMAAVDARFRNVAYWRLLSNLATSRAYHYTLLHAAQSRNLRGYRFVAVIDERTTAICRALNGQEFWVADAIAAMDRAFDSDDPEAVRTYLPWMDAADIAGLAAADLSALGVLIPPLHPFCRSTIQLIA